MRGAATHAVEPHAGDWLQAPLDALISAQRAALLPPSRGVDADADGGEVAGGDGAEGEGEGGKGGEGGEGGGGDLGNLGVNTALEPSPADVREESASSAASSAANSAPTGGAVAWHPGRMLSSYATRRTALRTYVGEPPTLSLAGSAFWGEDHDSAETQLRSFATACHLPREARLAALQTRSTLERLETALVALSRRRNRLRLEVAIYCDGTGRGE